MMLDSIEDLDKGPFCKPYGQLYYENLEKMPSFQVIEAYLSCLFEAKDGIQKAISVLEGILKKGSDIGVGMKVISKNSLITPLVIGSLKSIGIKEITVFEKLTALVISTGDEIVKDKDELQIGEIRDINTFTICNTLML